MIVANNPLEEDFENFCKRLGAVPIPEDQLWEWTNHVEQVVIPEIAQAIQDRIPTQEEIHQILY